MQAQPQPLRLSEITISNLRSIQRQTFPLSGITALIGYNNAGKTNILMGIRWLLSKFSLDISFFDDPNQPVEVDRISFIEASFLVCFLLIVCYFEICLCGIGFKNYIVCYLDVRV